MPAPMAASESTAENGIRRHAPHLHTTSTLPATMGMVVLALAPAILLGIVRFGVPALLLVGVSVLAAAMTDLTIRFIIRKKASVEDISAIVTGLLVAVNLPVGPSPWLAAATAAGAIIIKQLWGGLGKNLFNPALAAIALAHFVRSDDLLAAWHGLGSVPTTPAGHSLVSAVLQLFTGVSGSSIAEIAGALTLCGGILLLVRGVIRWHIPAAFITAALATAYFTMPVATAADRLAMLPPYLLGGGLPLYAFFMATDPPTSPLTGGGMLIYGAGCGALAILFRFGGGYPEAAPLSILVMNAAVPIIDRVTRPPVFGGASAGIRATRKELTE